MINDKFYNSSTAGQRGWAKYRDSENFKGLAALNYGVKIAPVPGDAHGRAPLFRPVITFLPSRHRSKVDRFINRRGIIGLVGFAVPASLIRAPLDRFRVGLMAEIPARENFKNTKTSKTSQISLGPREKLLGRAGLVL